MGPVLGVTRGQGIHPPAPGEMERAAVLAPVIAAVAAEVWLTIATHARRLLPAPRLCARHYPRGLGGIGEAGGTQGSRWPQGWAGDISLPTPTCAAGETEARAGFPSGLGHQRALGTPELCQWAPRAKPSRDTQGCTQGFTHTHTHAHVHTHLYTHRPTPLSPRRWLRTLTACLQRAGRGEPVPAPQHLTRLGQPCLPAPTSAQPRPTSGWAANPETGAPAPKGGELGVQAQERCTPAW